MNPPRDRLTVSGSREPIDSGIDRRSSTARITEDHEAPREFQDPIKRLTAVHGPYLLAFFLPGMVRPGGSGTSTIPSRVVLVHAGHLALLSSHSEFGEITTLVVNRSDLLGYRMTGFLLDCWITIYHASEPTQVHIQFPVQSRELYGELVTGLFHSKHHQSESANSAASQCVVPLNCPKLFTNFLHRYSESSEVRDCFLQSSVPFSNERRQKCANLVATRGQSGLFVLTDEKPTESSSLGLQASYFLLSSIRRANWVEPLQTQQGTLVLHIGQPLYPLRLEWSVALRFREAAVRWVKELNISLDEAKTHHARGAKLCLANRSDQ